MPGPWLATGAASTSATTCTACGLPIDSTETATSVPATSSASTGAPVPPSNGTAPGSKRGTPMSTVTSPSSSSRGTITPDFVSTRISR